MRILRILSALLKNTVHFFIRFEKARTKSLVIEMYRFARLARPTARLTLPVIPVSTHFRGFHVSPVSLKKRFNKKQPEVVVEDDKAIGAPDVDFKAIEASFSAVLDRFTKSANEAKLGRSNPQIFDRLSVRTSDGDQPFTALAQTAIKGRNFMITVFDPAMTKNIVNAVLDSGLNMTPIADPNNKQALKVPMPPVTTETKKEAVKSLKEVFEKFRNGPAGSSKNAQTLASIRGDLKKRLHKKQKKSDAESQVWDDIEKLHRTYCDKLNDVFKTAEKAMLK